jgi:RHS repeat-associated protein
MSVTNYIWDDEIDAVLMETDETGATTAVYENEPVPYGRLLSQRRGSETSYYHFDGLGSTRALTNQAGTVTDTYTYTAFGEEVAVAGMTQNPFRWVGQLGYYAEAAITALSSYCIRTRVYDGRVARWTSPDPAGFVDGVNRYIYVSNQPALRSDPSGLQALCTVELWCVNLVAWLGPKHCGIEINDGAVPNIFHVHGWPSGATCNIKSTRVSTFISGSYWKQATWTVPKAKCTCIRNTAALITASLLPYRAAPGNEPCGVSSCNSNYSAHCLLKHCGVTAGYAGWSAGGTPVGWNHRMKECLDLLIDYSPTGDLCCSCRY